MARLDKLLAIARMPYWLRILLRHGVAASTENGDAIRNLNVRTVIDIGANRGQFSLLVRGMLPTVQIEAFEPLPGPAKTFRKIFAADSATRLHECAIGERAEQREMHVSAADDSSSLLPITAEQTNTFPGTGEVGTIKVSVARLSDILDASSIQIPALLKLDVQGYELSTLKGCEDLLSRFDCIYCECSFMEMYEEQALADEVIFWLHERGFVTRGVYNVTYNREGKAVQADFMFERR